MKEKAPQTFADRLRALLDEFHGANQSELARIVETSPQAVSKWLTGPQLPRPAMLTKLAMHFGVTESYLLYGDIDAQVQTIPSGPRRQQPEYLLVFVEGTKELELLHHFRMGTEAGQRQLLLSAARIEKKPASELPTLPATALNQA